jgi:hypothetical protein
LKKLKTFGENVQFFCWLSFHIPNWNFIPARNFRFFITHESRRIVVVQKSGKITYIYLSNLRIIRATISNSTTITKSTLSFQVFFFPLKSIQCRYCLNLTHLVLFLSRSSFRWESEYLCQAVLWSVMPGIHLDDIRFTLQVLLAPPWDNILRLNPRNIHI